MSTGGGSPCGACKLLKRKCVAECVFAPYFGSEEGTAHFAAVHKVFGASNASKILMAIPASRRLDAAVTLCYEALARVRDPVYGCVSHILALQDRVMNLQAELAYVQTQLSTLQRPNPPQNNSPTEAVIASSNAQLIASTDNNKNVSSNSSLLHIHCMSQQQRQQLDESEDLEISTESVDFTRLSKLLGLVDPVTEDGDLNALALEFVSKYLSEGKCRPSSPI